MAGFGWIRLDLVGLGWTGVQKLCLSLLLLDCAKKLTPLFTVRCRYLPLKMRAGSRSYPEWAISGKKSYSDLVGYTRIWSDGLRQS
jgi:hypothetical protein